MPDSRNSPSSTHQRILSRISAASRTHSGHLVLNRFCFRGCVMLILIVQVMSEQFRAVDRTVFSDKFLNELPDKLPCFFGSCIVTLFCLPILVADHNDRAGHRSTDIPGPGNSRLPGWGSFGPDRRIRTNPARRFRRRSRETGWRGIRG